MHDVTKRVWNHFLAFAPSCGQNYYLPLYFICFCYIICIYVIKISLFPGIWFWLDNLFFLFQNTQNIHSHILCLMWSSRTCDSLRWSINRKYFWTCLLVYQGIETIFGVGALEIEKKKDWKKKTLFLQKRTYRLNSSSIYLILSEEYHAYSSIRRLINNSE